MKSFVNMQIYFEKSFPHTTVSNQDDSRIPIHKNRFLLQSNTNIRKNKTIRKKKNTFNKNIFLLYPLFICNKG